MIVVAHLREREREKRVQNEFIAWFGVDMVEGGWMVGWPPCVSALA